MKKLNLESLPELVGSMAEQITRIEKILNENTPPVEVPNKKFNLSEAASYCRMADSTFRTYIYQRKVAGTKFGKAWIFCQSDLDKFIADFRRPTESELKNEAFTNLTR